MTRKIRPQNRPIRILHVHSSFAGDAPSTRAVQLINAFGRACEHGIVSALPEEMSAAALIDPGITVDLPSDFPSLQGRPTPGRIQRLARAMLGHDLVLTYGYGAIHAVLAHTLCGGYLALPPLVHHEEEAGVLDWSHNWVRRIALGRAAALVVPSPQMAAIAVDVWHQPRGRVQCIVPGIRTAAYAARPRRDAMARVIKRDGELWLGTCADPAQLPIRLMRAFATLPEPWQLVMLGDRQHGDAVRSAALQLGIGRRLHLAEDVSDRSGVMGLFDLFALTSDGEPAPMTLVQAMAAGLAVVAQDGGDIAATLAPENRPFVVARADDSALAAVLQRLAQAPALRASLGAANRALARANHDEAAMVTAYRGVYGAALGRGAFP